MNYRAASCAVSLLLEIEELYLLYVTALPLLGNIFFYCFSISSFADCCDKKSIGPQFASP